MSQELGAVCTMLWPLLLGLAVMTTGAQNRGRRTLSERMGWRLARARAARRRQELERRLIDLSAPLDSKTLDHLQHQDTLYLASLQSMWRLSPCLLTSIGAGAALMSRVMRSDLDAWKEALAMVAMVSPIGLTVALLLAAELSTMQRWTYSVVSATARRSFEALLSPFDSDSTTPYKNSTFEPAWTSALRELGNFASALEKYAVQRALPDGRTPMPRVVARYASAAALLRALQSEVELNPVEGRLHALAEVRRMIIAMASGRFDDLAPNLVSGDHLLTNHETRQMKRRQVITLCMFTLASAGVIYPFAPSALTAIASLAGTAILGSWMKAFRLPAEQLEPSPSATNHEDTSTTSASGAGTPGPSLTDQIRRQERPANHR